MKDKGEKLNYSSAYREALARLAARPEFKAFLRLIEIEEKNIVVMAFKINSSDPDLSRKKAHLEGRIFQMRKIKNTFDWARKGTDEAVD
jgi:hypothetical protein